MGLLQGGATFARFRVVGELPAMITPEHLEQLRAQSIVDRQRLESSSGMRVGWSAGDHVTDPEFQFGKNVLGDTLFVQLCIETNSPPKEKLKSYYLQELAGLAKNNPSGHPSQLNKREAKEAARDRLELESRDGRFIRRRAVDVFWDLKTKEVWFGSASTTHAAYLNEIFKATFGVELASITSGSLCREFSMTDPEVGEADVELAGLSPFIPSLTPFECSWDPISESRDFVGNEFLMWLWFQCEDGTETIQLPDESNVTVFLWKTLTLECPRGQGGREVFTHEGPTRLSEALQAIRSGKLPRRSGMILVRHDVQYEIVIGAETWAVNGAKIPPPDDDDRSEHGRREARVNGVRELIATIDLLYRTFCRVRFSEAWPTQLGRMQTWLTREERRAA